MRGFAGLLFISGAAGLVGCSEFPGPANIPEERHAHPPCIDFAIAASHDARIPKTSFLLDVEVENHCGRPELLDLAKLAVWTAATSGDRHTMTLYDPRQEIVPLHIEAHGSVFERVRADGAGDDPAFSSLCFVAESALAPSAAPARPICFPLVEHDSSPEAGR